MGGRKQLPLAALILWFVFAVGAAEPAGRPPSVVESLIASYDKVQTVSAEIRRDTSGPAGRMRRLSTVHYARPDRLHVETVAPFRRRVVADGERLFSYFEGEAKGFCRPISELDFDWLVSLRQVPGTAMDHLLRLRGGVERELTDPAPFARRVGVQKGALHAVLCLDASNRLARVEYYRDAALQSLLSVHDYEFFEEPVPGIWFPLRQKAVLHLPDGACVEETTQVGNLRVNSPLSGELFEPRRHFPPVPFAADLEGNSVR